MRIVKTPEFEITNYCAASTFNLWPTACFSGKIKTCICCTPSLHCCEYVGNKQELRTWKPASQPAVGFLQVSHAKGTGAPAAHRTWSSCLVHVGCRDIVWNRWQLTNSEIMSILHTHTLFLKKNDRAMIYDISLSLRAEIELVTSLPRLPDRALANQDMREWKDHFRSCQI